MKRAIILLSVTLCLCGYPLFAQTPTVVSGTIVDPNGLPYSYARVSAQLIPSTASPTIIVNGIPVQIGGQQNATADVNGTFSMNLFCNAAGGGCSAISPGGTQWQFTVNETGTPPPVGTGPQSCTATITITGASQSISSSFSSCPALVRGGGQVVFASNYAVFDAQITWGCSYSIGNTTITCPNASFTSADIGKSEFATSISAAGFGTAVTSTTTIPYGTIVSVVNSTTVTVSIAPTANSVASKDSFNWGTPQGPQLNTAWHVAADACGTLVLPVGRIFSNRGQFNYYNPKCVAGAGAQKGGQDVTGQGMGATAIILTPDFDWTQGAGNSCDGYYSPHGCFLSVQNEIHASRFTIYGAGLNFTSKSADLINLACDNCSLRDLNFSSFDAVDGSTIGMLLSGAFMAVDNVIVDGWGGKPCSMTGGTPPSANPQRISNSYCGDSTGTAFTASAGIIESVNNYFQGLTADSVSVAANTDFNSVNDEYYSSSNSTSSGRALLTLASTARVKITNGNIYQTGTGLAVMAFGGGLIQFNHTRVSAPTGTALYIYDSTSKIVDDCGNVFSGSTILNNAGPGLYAGDCSVTGTAQTAGNIALTSGWGTSTVGTVSGNTKAEKWTVSVTGIPGASPVITVTFPTAFLVAPICSIQQVGGTFTLLNPAITSTVTAATITWSGTPVATQSYIFALNCGNP